MCALYTFEYANAAMPHLQEAGQEGVSTTLSPGKGDATVPELAHK